MRPLVYNDETMNVAAPQGGVGDRIVPHRHIRTMRMQRHLVFAGLASAAYVVSGPTTNSLMGIIVLAAYTYVVLESVGRAVDARLGFWWGWLYGEPEHSTRLDLAVDRIVHRLVSAQAGTPSAPAFAEEATDREPRIRILPPGSEES